MDDAGQEAPLVQAMAAIALAVVQRIVVRSPVVAVLQEMKHEREGGPMYEVIARTGILLRGPFALVGWSRRPLVRRPAEVVAPPALMA